MQWYGVMILGVLLSACVLEADSADGPFASFTREWRDDPVWHDGQAECATYEATRVIYGQARSYVARVYLNKEHASPKTFTKSSDGTGRAVFKLHMREDIPTENYTYHYSTMCYVGVDDLKSLKLDMGSQEDCGATFKQYVNHAGELTWVQHSYFPDEGTRSGRMQPRQEFVFEDALPVVLRGYPFDDPPGEMVLQMLHDQTDNHLTLPDELSGEGAVLRYAGREALDLPFGRVEAHHLVVVRGEGAGELELWFAAEEALGGVMVRMRSSDGRELRLKSVERRAYWRR